jgi:hypothetical protein
VLIACGVFCALFALLGLVAIFAELNDRRGVPHGRRRHAVDVAPQALTAAAPHLPQGGQQDSRPGAELLMRA